MDVVLFDEEIIWKNFLPLTFTRPVSEIRIGVLTIREKWDFALGVQCSYHTKVYLSHKYPLKVSPSFLLINSKYLPDLNLVNAVKALKPEQALYRHEHLIAFNGQVTDLEDLTALERVDYPNMVFEINHLWDIFQKNAEAIKADFAMLTANKTSAPVSETVTVIGDRSLLFLEPGAKAEACVINTQTGPVYLGKDSEIMEGVAIRGPLALGEHSVLKLNAKVYGATTIGPYCKVGGEVSNSVIFGYSNKAHDGFLGNSVIGEWCNLGADTNNSNLKNNYGNVKLFSYDKGKQVDTGLQFCGLIMADHSKSGINTMFNTGTVVGVGCNIYGAGFPDTHIPEFSWGGAEGFAVYQLEKLFETADIMHERRGLVFSETDKEILSTIFEKAV